MIRLLKVRGSFCGLSISRHLSTGTEVVTEGSASILLSKSNEVFFNKDQVLNRDLSVEVIKLFAKFRKQERVASRKNDRCGLGINILEAFGATGLRSIRYLKEIAEVEHVTINDIDPIACNSAIENVTFNGVDRSRVTVCTGDASLLMYQHRQHGQQFDVIDLDPYGSACSYLDAAVQAVSDGGLLCVSCTDMSVFCGNYPEKCNANYGSVPIKAKYKHEMALRILLHSIDATANKYKRYVEPWLSLSVDHYVRVFVRIHHSPKEVKKSILKKSMVYQSVQCPSFYLQPLGVVTALSLSTTGCDDDANGDGEDSRTPPTTGPGSFSPAVVSAPVSCPTTGGRMKVGGPIWSDPIHSQDIVRELLFQISSRSIAQKFHAKPNTTEYVPIASQKRLCKLLTVISEELPDCPLFYTIPLLAHQVKIVPPSRHLFYTALAKGGYRYSIFHHEPTALKTDAPPEFIWDLMKRYSDAATNDKGCKKSSTNRSANTYSKSDVALTNKVCNVAVCRYVVSLLDYRLWCLLIIIYSTHKVDLNASRRTRRSCNNVEKHVDAKIDISGKSESNNTGLFVVVSSYDLLLTFAL